jgi:hypothetical protein
MKTRGEEERDRLDEEVATFGRGWLREHGDRYATDDDRLDALFEAVDAKYGRALAILYCENLDVSAYRPPSAGHS